MARPIYSGSRLGYPTGHGERRREEILENQIAKREDVQAHEQAQQAAKAKTDIDLRTLIEAGADRRTGQTLENQREVTGMQQSGATERQRLAGTQQMSLQELVNAGSLERQGASDTAAKQRLGLSAIFDAGKTGVSPGAFFDPDSLVDILDLQKRAAERSARSARVGKVFDIVSNVAGKSEVPMAGAEIAKLYQDTSAGILGLGQEDGKDPVGSFIEQVLSGGSGPPAATPPARQAPAPPSVAPPSSGGVDLASLLGSGGTTKPTTPAPQQPTAASRTAREARTRPKEPTTAQTMATAVGEGGKMVGPYRMHPENYPSLGERILAFLGQTQTQLPEQDRFPWMRTQK